MDDNWFNIFNVYNLVWYVILLIMMCVSVTMVYNIIVSIFKYQFHSAITGFKYLESVLFDDDTSMWTRFNFRADMIMRIPHDYKFATPVDINNIKRLIDSGINTSLIAYNNLLFVKVVDGHCRSVDDTSRDMYEYNTGHGTRNLTHEQKLLANQHVYTTSNTITLTSIYSFTDTNIINVNAWDENKLMIFTVHNDNIWTVSNPNTIKANHIKVLTFVDV